MKLLCKILSYLNQSIWANLFFFRRLSNTYREKKTLRFVRNFKRNWKIPFLLKLIPRQCFFPMLIYTRNSFAVLFKSINQLQRNDHWHRSPLFLILFPKISSILPLFSSFFPLFFSFNYFLTLCLFEKRKKKKINQPSFIRTHTLQNISK